MKKITALILVLGCLLATCFASGAMTELQDTKSLKTNYENQNVETVVWKELQKLHASDGAADSLFGSSFSVDGDYALIGAYAKNDETGAVYVFKRDGASWVQEAKLIASDGAKNDDFGYSVSINGNYAIIGAPGDDTKGSAYIFSLNDNEWTQNSKIVSPDEGENWFGNTVSIEGDYAIIGAPAYNSLSGAVYTFKRSANTWMQEARILTLKDQDKIGLDSKLT